MAKTAMLEQYATPSERLLSLANEYTTKLNEMVNSVAIFLSDLEYGEDVPRHSRGKRDPECYKLGFVVEMGRNILPLTMDLAQAMSQQIEHGSIEGVVRLGIRLKLAELEVSIRALERMLADKRVQFYYKSGS